MKYIFMPKKPAYSTEMAHLRVQNDILQAVDSNWKLVDTTKEYEDGYAKCIQVQENHYRWEMYKQK